MDPKSPSRLNDYLHFPESDDDSVLDENTAHMCNIHAHLLITLRNASLGELDEARVRSVLCALLFMSTRHEWNEDDLAGDKQRDDAEEFTHVDGGTRGRRQQQRPQRLGLPFTFERPSQRQRAGERNRNPEDSSRTVLGGTSLPHEREREDQHTGDGKEEGRVRDFETPDLDRQVLA